MQWEKLRDAVGKFLAVKGQQFSDPGQITRSSDTSCDLFALRSEETCGDPPAIRSTRQNVRKQQIGDQGRALQKVQGIKEGLQSIPTDSFESDADQIQLPEPRAGLRNPEQPGFDQSEFDWWDLTFESAGFEGFGDLELMNNFRIL